jgi:serine phosphatase RsbU (regulator of sigma subunit)
VRLIRARTVGDALRRLAEPIDCIVLDLGLPDASGLATLPRLRHAAPATAVIVLTGENDEAAGEAAVHAGAQDYLVKGTVDGGLLARSIRYAVSRRHAEEVQQQLRVAELQAAETARLERGLVPRPIVSGPSIWLASSYLPAGGRALLGGDFFDAVESASGRLLLLIGDVSGRGPDAAALGAALRIAWRALTLAGFSGEEVIVSLHRLAEHERQDPEMFATLCTIEIDPRQGRMWMERAGHPPPLLIASGRIDSLPLTGGGPPVGMFADCRWERQELSLPPDWALLLFTDGLVEATVGDGGSRLGEAGLARIVGEHVDRHPGWRQDPHSLLRALVDIVEAMGGEELVDDVAMLLVGVRDGPGGAGGRERA